MSARVHGLRTEFEHNVAQPVVRQDMTSLWSPKIDKARKATVRAESVERGGYLWLRFVA